MAKGSTFQNELLLLIYNNTSITGLATASGATSIWVALHTADPSSGTAATSEATYGGYARLQLTRSNTDWTVTGNAATNANNAVWPTSTDATAETITHFSTTDAASGTSRVIHSGTVTSNISMGLGVTPRALAGDLDITES